MKKFRYNDTDIFVQEQGDCAVRLLQVSKKSKLSSIGSTEGKIKSITNASYFTSSYVLGRNQGDMYNNTTNQDQTPSWQLVITKDNKYHLGQYNSWDYTDKNDVLAGFNVGCVLIKDGQDVELISETHKESVAITTKKPQTMFGYNNGKFIQFICDGRSSSNAGLASKTFRNWIRTQYPNIELLVQMDGGGSTEMIVDKKIVNVPSDGNERLMFNGFAFIEKDKSIIIPEEKKDEPVKNKNMFIPRVSKSGLMNNKYWYDPEYNATTSTLQLPNCTCYALGRSSELAGKNVKGFDMLNRSGFGNAYSWYSEALWEKGSEPKLGAVCVWDKTSTNAAGHVAVVEKINDDGTVLCSMSNYTSNKKESDPNYFVLKTYNNIVGKAPSSSIGKFLGYIYNPYICDYSTTRDASKNQVEVLIDNLRVRTSPNGDSLAGRAMPIGLFDVLEIVEQDGYKWCKVAENAWFALNDDGGWTSTHLVATKEEVIINTELLENKIAEQAKEIAALLTRIDELNLSVQSKDLEISQITKTLEFVENNNAKLNEELSSNIEKLSQVKQHLDSISSLFI